ncbi:MAG: hypothetical protein M1819_004311 [Sarea resinae]|nr:MAG: hypothetical protein M1819_004311 [Sarea resinae]
MPVSMASSASEPAENVFKAPFPAKTKQASGLVNGVQTDVMSLSFADKIMITISQDGRLAQWVHVPLDTVNPSDSNHYIGPDAEDGGLLPMPHLTATTLLGGTVPERETLGQLFATQIASAIATKNPEEKRMVVVGLGLAKAEADRETFFDVIELVLQCL